MRRSPVRAVWMLSPMLVWALGVPGSAARAQEVTKGATVEGITEYMLANGLKVLLFPDPSKPTITVNITYLVGSRHEGYGETGMAHLLEHLVFKGTPKHPNIPQELTERGARPNGTTWFDRTNYFETFPASEDNLRWALDLEADRMVNSFIAQKDLASEMTVVRNEFELGENSPLRVLLERTLATMYLWHGYGRSTIGARSDIESVPIERLQAFYRKYYQPDNAVLVVAGKFDEQTALRMIGETFGKIPRPDRSEWNRIYPTYTREPVQDGERMVTVRRVGDEQLVMAAYHVPPGSHEDFAAVDILARVLGDTPAGRLHKALVETGKAAGIGNVAFQLKEAGPLLLFAQVRPDSSLDAAWGAMEATLDSVTVKPITDEEVNRARQALLAEIELAFNSSERIALDLSEWAAMGDWRLFFIHRDRLKKVTTEDVRRVAARYLKPQNRTVGFFRPTKEPDRAEIPEAPDIGALVAGYKGASDVAAGEAFDPSPENIEARTTRRSYSSGFKLALLPKRTRGGSVNASFRILFGTEQSLMHRGAVGDLTAAMLMRGTAKRSRQEIQDELDRLKARVFVGGGLTATNGSVQTTRENLAAVLRLLGEVLREPAFDTAEFRQLKEEQIAQLEAQRSEPNALAFVALERHLNPRPKGHPNYTPTFDEQIDAIKAVTIDDVRAFYRQFYGAARGHMAIVGDFDPAEIEPIVAEIFGQWTAPSPTARIPSVFYDAPATRLVIQTPDKANAIYVAGLNLKLGDGDPEYPALALANYMLGGGFLNSRLATRVRQQEGLSYGVGSQVSAHPVDGTGELTIFAIYAPQNRDKVEAAIREELERAVRDGFTPEEVEAAKTGYLQSRQVSRSQDGTLAGMLSQWLYFDRTMAWDAAFEAKVRSLTPEQILQALRRHVDPARISVAVAGDFRGG